MVHILIVGGGPAGLMAAQTAVERGAQVTLCDAMPSVGRKFLLAGRGGLNLTHSDPLPVFAGRYGRDAGRFTPWLEAFGPTEMRTWAAGLGVETFVGTSGRVFPAEFKAAPLLRAWVRHLRERGVRFALRHRWTGFDRSGGFRFATPAGDRILTADAAILAVGGGSWPHLGSDGAWIPAIKALGCEVAPLLPANCGFAVDWSAHMVPHFGKPLKSIALSFAGTRVRGEVMLTGYGIEGGAVYALSAAIRDASLAAGNARVMLDLKPDLDGDRLALRLQVLPRGRQSLSNWLRKAAALPPQAAALLRETGASFEDAGRLAERIKALPLTLGQPRPLAEAISSAGGLAFDDLDERLMLRKSPGLFAAGEMLDWEAPTGGYLLTGCFTTGRHAALGALAWLEETSARPGAGDSRGGQDTWRSPIEAPRPG